MGTKNQTQAETASAGQCTRADEAEMKKFGGGSKAGSFPTVLADCGRKASAGSDGTDTKWRSALGRQSRSVPLAQSASARRASTATRSASANASSGSGALSGAWAALQSTMLKPRRASALTCRSRMSADIGCEGLEFSLPDDATSA